VSPATSAAFDESTAPLAHDTLRSPPPDWPAPGAIDLSVHDLPHASSALEWWYVNSHFETTEGRSMSLFAAFFRHTTGFDAATGESAYTYSVTWALSNPAERRYHARAAVDASAAQFGLRKLDAGEGADDERINRALREVFERGHIPGPTQVFASAAVARDGQLLLDYGGDRFFKQMDGSYRLQLHDDRSKSGCDLVFRPNKPPTRHGSSGVVHGVADELMFYYFVPRCDVSGRVVVEGQREVVRDGNGWYDHEFGVVSKDAEAVGSNSGRCGRETAWRWVSVQLDGGVDVSVYIITRSDTGEVLDNWTIISDPRGGATQFTDAELEPISSWRSTRSFVEYPIAWRLEVPSAGLRLHIYASFADQEVITIISDPGFWEGRVNVYGSYKSHAAVGLGWVECKGFRFNDLDAFFGAVGAEVRERVADLLSLSPSSEQIRHWGVRGDGASRERVDYMHGLQPTQIVRALIQPIRDITDRGGKSWRSFAALASVDVVGGDSRKFLHWLALPELLHVGSLIVDDVEDRSSIRRGGPTCHLLHGEPHAINAGTAAYFFAEPPVMDDDLPLPAKLRIYRLYFDAIRAAHIGQALDLDGLDELSPAVVETGNTNELEQAILGIHRLKTAVPAGMLARIGAILGGGTEAQIEALGCFFEAVGLAFQIVDDVLNVRGFKGDLKERGEDVRQGKITLPIVKASQILSQIERRWLFEALSSNEKDAELVASVIGKLEDTGALETCMRQARELVEIAWSALEPLLEESQSKVMFRAFGWYVLERHY
jgi:geranylgeranyl pyrophosphate synthase/predicted secreted hydrolase